MQSLDYVRQAVTYFRKEMKQLKSLTRRGNKSFTKEAIAAHEKVFEDIYDMMLHGQKFVLPDGGSVLDTGLRGLPTFYNLPYPVTVLEYPITSEQKGNLEKNNIDVLYSKKRIVVARQVKPGDAIGIFSIYHQEKHQNILNMDLWVVFPFYILLGATNMGRLKEGQQLQWESHRIPNNINGHTDMSTTEVLWNMEAEMFSVLSLLEVLSCKNIGTEIVKGKKHTALERARGILPENDYHVLVVNPGKSKINPEAQVVGVGSDGHRSLREHLRRGHIRNLASGEKVWVQSTVVNAGASATIIKDYAVKN